MYCQCAYFIIYLLDIPVIEKKNVINFCSKIICQTQLGFSFKEKIRECVRQADVSEWEDKESSSSLKSIGMQGEKDLNQFADLKDMQPNPKSDYSSLAFFQSIRTNFLVVELFVIYFSGK